MHTGLPTHKRNCDVLRRGVVGVLDLKALIDDPLVNAVIVVRKEVEHVTFLVLG